MMNELPGQVAGTHRARQVYDVQVPVCWVHPDLATWRHAGRVPVLRMVTRSALYW